MTEKLNFSQDELNAVKDTLQERFKKSIETQLADVELRLNPSSSVLTPCPAIYWEARGCHFIICKLGEGRFKNQFYYRVHEQFGTGREEYDDIVDCVVTLLQVQADHEAEREAEGNS